MVQSVLKGHLKTCDGKLLGVGLDYDGFGGGTLLEAPSLYSLATEPLYLFIYLPSPAYNKAFPDA